MPERNWLTSVSECLTAVEREQAGSACPVIDHEIVRGLSGDAGDATIWLICRNEAEQRQFADNELSRTIASVRRKLIAAGFPESAVDTLSFRVTSREEVDRRGGHSFLR